MKKIPDEPDKQFVKRTISVQSEQESEIDVSTTQNDLSLYEAGKEDKSDVSILEIIKENRPEWLEVSIGCICSLIMGAAMPVFAIIFGDIIGVR